MGDRRALWSSVAIAALGTAAGLIYCVWGYGPLHGHRDWWGNPTDSFMLTNAGSLLLHGHLGAVYSTDRGLSALPLSFPLTGLAALAVTWLHLPSAPHQEWVFVVVPAFGAMAVPALYQLRCLARELGVERRLTELQLGAAVMIFVPLVEWGHPEDVLALAFVLAALRKMISADPLRACLSLSVAVSFKQWAVMLVPLAVLTAPRERRIRAALLSCALPAALALLFLGVDFHHALRAFLEPTTDVQSAPGQPSPLGSWLGSHTSQVNRMAATVLAAAVCWRRRSVSDPTDIAGAAALVLALRPLSETVSYSYYWPPALLLVALTISARRGEFRGRDWLWPVVALLWTVPRSKGVLSPGFWLGEAVVLLLAATVWRRASDRHRRVPEGGPPLPAACRQFAEVAG